MGGQCDQRVQTVCGVPRHKVVDVFLDKACVCLAREHTCVCEQRHEEADVVLQTEDVEVLQGEGGARKRGLTRFTRRDDFGDHRVVVHGDVLTFAHTRIDPYPRPLRLAIPE